MSLVTRGLGKTIAVGAIATLVSFGLGISTPVQQPVVPSVVQNSARFLQDGYFIVRPEHVTNYNVYQFTVVDIDLSVQSNTEIVYETVETVKQVVKPATVTYEYSLDFIIPSIDVVNTFKWYNYNDSLIEKEDETLFLGYSLESTEYPGLIYNDYIVNTSVDIQLTGYNKISGSYKEELKRQNIEEEELILFDNLLI